MATGTATINFGTATALKPDASVAVTGQTGILSTSRTEAWLSLTATADHSSDEVLAEAVHLWAGPPTAGVGFTIFGFVPLGLTFGNFTVQWAWV